MHPEEQFEKYGFVGKSQMMIKRELMIKNGYVTQKMISEEINNTDFSVRKPKTITEETKEEVKKQLELMEKEMVRIDDEKMEINLKYHEELINISR